MCICYSFQITLTVYYQATVSLPLVLSPLKRGEDKRESEKKKMEDAKMNSSVATRASGLPRRVWTDPPSTAGELLAARHLHNETSIDFGFSIRDAGWIPFRFQLLLRWLEWENGPNTDSCRRKREEKIAWFYFSFFLFHKRAAACETSCSFRFFFFCGCRLIALVISGFIDLFESRELPHCYSVEQSAATSATTLLNKDTSLGCMSQ